MKLTKKELKSLIQEVVEERKQSSMILSEVTWANAKAKIKSLIVNPGKKLSYQKHSLRNEHWFVIKGNATIKLNGEEFKVETFNYFDIKVEDWHQLINNGDDDLIVVEVQFGDECIEEDIENFNY